LNLEARNPSPLFKRNLVRGFSCLPAYLIKFESGNQEPTFPEKGMFLSDFETRSAPVLARRYPRDFTVYLGNPFPRLKLVGLPLSLTATLAALPSISKIPFLDSRVTA
jgi:hypothetical protein